jgi:putative transposase
MRYRRTNAAGGTYFFTVNLAEQCCNISVRHIDDLRAAMKTVKNTHPFDNGDVTRTPACNITFVTG